MSNSKVEVKRRDAEHLDDVPDGAGCAEVWDCLSAERTAKNKAEYREQTRGQVTQEGH